MTPRRQSLDRTNYPLCLPTDVADEIRRLATAHERSFNAEVVWALRQYIRQIASSPDHLHDKE